MKILKKIAIVIVLLLAVFLVVAALQNPEYRLSRSQVMDVAPEVVFPQVNNFHNWEQWSPWAKADPQAKYSFEGPDSGIGAVFGWSGNMKVGTGRMTILESRPAGLIRIRLDFFKPMEGTDTSEFAFKPVGQGTEVTWSTHGRKNFVAKAMCMFVSMEKMIGPNFEKGLAQMKTIVESAKKPDTSAAKGG